MDILDELYQGNIQPNFQTIRSSTEREKRIKKLKILNEKLRSTLDKEQIAVLDEMEQIQCELEEAEKKEEFKTGFRIGVKTIVAVYDSVE